MKSIKQYLDEKHLLHPGRPRNTTSKSQKAKQRKKMRRYWQYKDTTFDE